MNGCDKATTLPHRDFGSNSSSDLLGWPRNDWRLVGLSCQTNELVCHEPTPELAAEFAEQYARLLAKLPSQELIELAVKKMEGYTNEEIATQFGKSERTIERKLQLIRKIWLSSSVDLTTP